MLAVVLSTVNTAKLLNMNLKLAIISIIVICADVFY